MMQGWSLLSSGRSDEFTDPSYTHLCKVLALEYPFQMLLWYFMWMSPIIIDSNGFFDILLTPVFILRCTEVTFPNVILVNIDTWCRVQISNQFFDFFLASMLHWSNPFSWITVSDVWRRVEISLSSSSHRFFDFFLASIFVMYWSKPSWWRAVFWCMVQSWDLSSNSEGFFDFLLVYTGVTFRLIAVFWYIL